MQVRNLMRSPVVAVGPDQSLQSAAQVMAAWHRLGGGGAGRPGGRHPHRARRCTPPPSSATSARPGRRPHDRPVVTASPNWDVSVAAAEMHERRIRHLVVLDQGAAAGVLLVRDDVGVPARAVHRQEP